MECICVPGNRMGNDFRLLDKRLDKENKLNGNTQDQKEYHRQKNQPFLQVPIYDLAESRNNQCGTDRGEEGFFHCYDGSRPKLAETSFQGYLKKYDE